MLRKPKPKYGWSGQRSFQAGDRVKYIGEWDFLGFYDLDPPPGGTYGTLRGIDPGPWLEDDQCTGQVVWTILFEGFEDEDERLAFEGQLEHAA